MASQSIRSSYSLSLVRVVPLSNASSSKRMLHDTLIKKLSYKGHNDKKKLPIMMYRLLTGHTSLSCLRKSNPSPIKRAAQFDMRCIVELPIQSPTLAFTIVDSASRVCVVDLATRQCSAKSIGSTVPQLAAAHNLKAPVASLQQHDHRRPFAARRPTRGRPWAQCRHAKQPTA